MRHTSLALSIATGIHLFALAIWYGPPVGHPFLVSGLLDAGSVVGGFIVGFFPKSRFVLNVLLLSVWQALVTGGVHLLAAYFGLQVDMPRIDSLILVIPLIPIFAFFTSLGGGAGRLMYWLYSARR